MTDVQIPTEMDRNLVVLARNGDITINLCFILTVLTMIVNRSKALLRDKFGQLRTYTMCVSTNCPFPPSPLLQRDYAVAFRSPVNKAMRPSRRKDHLASLSYAPKAVSNL